MADNVKEPEQGGGRALGVHIFFKAVVQSVLLFGENTWVVNPRMGRVLGFFQDQVERPLMGQIPERWSDGRW